MKMKPTGIFSLVVLLLLFVAACQNAVQQESKATEAAVEATGNAAVDSVSKDLSSAAADERELSGEGLEGIDSGLNDMQNI